MIYFKFFKLIYLYYILKVWGKYYGDLVYFLIYIFLYKIKNIEKWYWKFLELDIVILVVNDVMLKI